MNHKSPDPTATDLARQLLASEATAGQFSKNGHGLERVLEKLRNTLNPLAGASGFHSLLSRALTLAKAQSPALHKVQVRLDGVVDGIDGMGDDPADTASTLRVAQFVSLLITFIGESLVRRLLLDAWPDLPQFDPEFDSELSRRP